MAFKITGAFLIFWLPSIFILGDAASQVTKQGLIMKHLFLVKYNKSTSCILSQGSLNQKVTNAVLRHCSCTC